MARLYNIDFLRIIFCLIIVYFHILNENIMKFIGNSNISSLYQKLSVNCAKSYFIVDFFCIIAGFFIYKNFLNNKDVSWWDFTKNKIARLWPVYAFCNIIYILIGYKNFQVNMLSLFFLESTGLTLDYKGINWFVSLFFWGVILFYYLIKNFSKKYIDLVFALIIYLSLVLHINTFNGNLGFIVINAMVPSGILRILTGLGIGYFICNYCEYHKLQPVRKDTKLSFIFISILELFTCAILFCFMLFHTPTYSNGIQYIIGFIILFILFLFKKGLISKILNNKSLGFLGKFSYSTYIMQQLSFFILGKTLWKETSFISNIYLSLSVSLLVSFIIGIITYYLVEKPAYKYLKKHFIKHNDINNSEYTNII